MESFSTPIRHYGSIGQTDVFLKREDMIPFSFGGNKVRIMEEVFEEMKKKGCDALISYGSISSNLNRVAVHMAAREKVPLTVIVKREELTPDSGARTGFNEQMVLDSGARILYTEPGRVKETVEQAAAEKKEEGYRPFYLYGDSTGKGTEALLAEAYRKVFREITEQEKETGLSFDTLALPVGTGATLAGLVLGCDKAHRILGISVSRSREKILEKLKTDLEAAGLPSSEAEEKRKCCEITDRYLQGGYGPADEETKKELLKIFRQKGLPLDPVYSGKAFTGMREEIQKGNLRGNVLFLHTGGLPLFFDMLAEASGGKS